MTKQEFAQANGIWVGNPNLDALYAASGNGKISNIGQYLSAAAQGPSIPGVPNSIGDAYNKAMQYQKDQVFNNVEEQKTAPPPIDPRLQEIEQGQIDQAKEFRNNIPQMADSLMGQIAQVNKQNLAAEIDRTRKSYNQRGLLYSTARQGAEGAARTAAASDLATERENVNTGLQDKANQLDQNAINTGFNIASQGQIGGQEQTKLNSEYMDLALQNQQMNNAALQSALKGVGSGLGYLGGYLGKSNGTAGLQTTPIPGAATGTNYSDYGGYGGMVG